MLLHGVFVQTINLKKFPPWIIGQRQFSNSSLVLTVVTWWVFCSHISWKLQMAELKCWIFICLLLSILNVDALTTNKSSQTLLVTNIKDRWSVTALSTVSGNAFHLLMPFTWYSRVRNTVNRRTPNVPTLSGNECPISVILFQPRLTSNNSLHFVVSAHTNTSDVREQFKYVSAFLWRQAFTEIN